MKRALGWGLLALVACSSEHIDKPMTPAPDAGGDGGGEAVTAAGAPETSGGGGVVEAGGAAGELAHGGTGGVRDEGCEVPVLGDIEVFSPNWDPLGYAPYAVDGCVLVYVSAEGGGSLRRRDLATGDETVLETAASHPRRPTLSGDVIAWERDGAGGREVSVVTTSPSARNRHFDHAGEPRATGDAVVFTKFLGSQPTSDTDVVLYDVEADELVTIGTGPAQQRFADVSPTHVAFTDFSEDPDGYFNEAGSISDIVLLDRESGELRVRAAPGKQAFPLLGSEGVLAYLEWGAVHPEPKFSQFVIKSGYVGEPVTADFAVKPGGPVSTNPAYVRPSVRGTFLDYIDRPSQRAELFRARLDAPGAPTPVAIADADQLFGPAAAQAFTLISKPGAAQHLTLVAIAR